MSIYQKFKDFLFGSHLRLNIFSGFAATGLNSLLNLIKFPLFLVFISYNDFGMFSILAIIPQLGNAGMLGVAPAVAKLISEELGRSNHAKACAYLHTALLFITIAGVIIILAIIAGEPLFCKFMALSPENEQLFRRCFLLACLVAFLTFLNQPLEAALIGIGRMDIANLMRVGQNFLLIIFSWIALLFQAEVRSILIATAIAIIIIIVCEIVILLRLKMNFLRSHGTLSLLYSLLRFGVPCTVATLLQSLTLAAIKIILARIGGTTVLVGFFQIAYSLAAPILTLMNAGFQALLPEISKLSACETKDNRKSLEQINGKTLLVTFLGGIIICTIIYIVCPWILQLWLRSRFESELVPIFRSMIPLMLFAILSIMPHYNNLGRGYVWVHFQYYAINTAITLACISVAYFMCHFTSGIWSGLGMGAGQMIAVIYLFFRRREEVKTAISALIANYRKHQCFKAI